MSFNLRIEIDECDEVPQMIEVKSMREAVGVAQKEYECYLAANGEPLNDKFNWDGVGVYEIGGRWYSIVIQQVLVDYDVTFINKLGTINFCGWFETMDAFDKYMKGHGNFSSVPESHRVLSAKIMEGIYVKEKGWPHGVFKAFKEVGVIRGDHEKLVGELVGKIEKLLHREQLPQRIIALVLEQLSHADLGLMPETHVAMMDKYLNTILDGVRNEVHAVYRNAIAEIAKSK